MNICPPHTHTHTAVNTLTRALTFVLANICQREALAARQTLVIYSFPHAFFAVSLFSLFGFSFFSFFFFGATRHAATIFTIFGERARARRNQINK